MTVNPINAFPVNFLRISRFILILSNMMGGMTEIESECISEVAQSCPTLCDPMDCSLQRSSIREIFQARVLAWDAISSSGGSSGPRD